jgi:hypothetical protein
VKPGWGRSAPSKAAVVTKGLSVRAKAQGTKLALCLKTTGKVAPKDIPLPPSPKRQKKPTSVPLPPSPKPPKADEKAGEVPKEVEGVSVPAMEEAPPIRHVEGPTNELVPAVPFFPGIQEPVESTPTPSQKHLAGPTGTPISTLLTSIQQGFLFTPCSPLSPPQTYLPLTIDDEAEIDSPTPTFARPGEAKKPQPLDHSAPQASNDVGRRIPELTFALEEAKAPGGEDEIGRQVLRDVEVNQ